MNCLTQQTADVLELNRSCFCLSLDRDKVLRRIETLPTPADVNALIAQRENLFASSGVFLSSDDKLSMRDQIDAIESAVASRQFQSAVLPREGTVHHAQTGTRGVLMGYDFHVTPDGPRLIEINTNAGGAFLVNTLKRAVVGSDQNDALVEMFVREWALSGRTVELETIAIVDTDPELQYLYPDMRLAQELLVRAGFQAVIVRPDQLAIAGNRLVVGSMPIDLVYNRLTDFHFSLPESGVLRRALVEDLAVITPSPRHHALFANKRNLSLLTDTVRLEELDVPVRVPLDQVPQTELVREADPDDLWRRRKGLFFKPVDGYGSKSVYRGSKLTRNVWDRIRAGDFVAQTLVPPATRAIARSHERVTLKYDVRVYTHAGKALLFAARVYEGQTTNFRTQGGGLALIMDDALIEAAIAEGDECCDWLHVLTY